MPFVRAADRVRVQAHAALDLVREADRGSPRRQWMPRSATPKTSRNWSPTRSTMPLEVRLRGDGLLDAWLITASSSRAFLRVRRCARRPWPRVRRRSAGWPAPPPTAATSRAGHESASWKRRTRRRGRNRAGEQLALRDQRHDELERWSRRSGALSGPWHQRDRVRAQASLEPGHDRGEQLRPRPRRGAAAASLRSPDRRGFEHQQRHALGGAGEFGRLVDQGSRAARPRCATRSCSSPVSPGARTARAGWPRPPGGPRAARAAGCDARASGQPGGHEPTDSSCLFSELRRNTRLARPARLAHREAVGAPAPRAFAVAAGGAQRRL